MEGGRVVAWDRACIRPHFFLDSSAVSHHGGIFPAIRQRSAQPLTLGEREDISRGIASGESIRDIASALSRAAPTVSREVTRHGGRAVYRACEADSEAWKSALRPKLCLLAANEQLRELVVSKLILDWLPEQVAGWLKS
jgi:IS30 family transposase